MTHQDPRFFTINLRQVQQGDDTLKRAWRGKLQSLPDGEAYYFREWKGLFQCLKRNLVVRRDPPRL